MSTLATTTQVDKTPSARRDIEAILRAMRICHRNQETKIWILQKFMHALQEGEATSKLHLQPRLSQLDGFRAMRSSYNEEAFGGILKQVEQNYSKLLSEEKNLTQDLRNVIPSSVLFIMSPSTYRDKDKISNWIPVVLPQDDWRLFEGLEYGGKQPCWVTSTSHTGISGMVNAGIWLGLTLRSFGCSIDFLDGHWHTLIQRKKVDDLEGWITYLIHRSGQALWPEAREYLCRSTFTI